MPSETVYLYVTDTMADWEAAYAIAHIERPSWQRSPGRYRVRTVGVSRTPITTMGGVRITPDLALSELSLDDAAVLILTGADTWGPAGAHASALDAARRMLGEGRPVAAICGATYGLARAGLLDDRRHTSNAPVFLDASGYAGGGLYVDEPAVCDRGLITASGVWPVEFAVEIFRALELYEPHVLESWHGLYTTGEERHFAALMAA
ncbi:MAG: type 1 glutamine amidotransferase family protein [Solirubrobacteraceae bacterium]|jgi:putative intracellular protease/amidase